MAMTTPFLLMKDNRPRLAIEAKFVFDPRDCRFEIRRPDDRRGRRIEGKRKEILLAPCATTDRVGFVQGAAQILCEETAKFVNLNMVIFLLQEMQGELRPAAALIADEDH
ncbi:hypothetical protein CCR93_15425 [Rhodobium orientis]|nr:hypothetical protein [Rhodobium orientis]